MEDMKKKPLNGNFKKAVKMTAMTFGMMFSVQSFAQEGCEDSGGWDDDCVNLPPIGVTGPSDDGGGGGSWWDNPGYWGGGGYSGGGSSGGSSGGGGGGGAMTIRNKPNNPHRVYGCDDLLPHRRTHAMADLGHAWNSGQKPRVGSRITIDYGNHTEQWLFSGMAAPLVVVSGTCRAK